MIRTEQRQEVLRAFAAGEDRMAASAHKNREPGRFLLSEVFSYDFTLTLSYTAAMPSLFSRALRAAFSLRSLARRRSSLGFS